MVAKLSVDTFLELVRRSDLVTAGQLCEALAEIRMASSTRSMNDVELVADDLVNAGLLTRWQCDKLLGGRCKGFLLGKYKLLCHLGSGGMSSVYLAEHVPMQRRVALKILPSERAADAPFLARFQLEAQAAAALDHVNIVRAYDIGYENEIHFIVMEYVPGRNLADLIADDGLLSYSLAANYIAQAADGLEHAHRKGLVHRDIKPANLLVDPSGTVKILDLGLVKFADGQESSLTIADECALGTVDYLAPEQAINSHTVDHRADIYSLGCTLYFLLVGRPPFNQGPLAQRLLAHQNATPPPIAVERPDVPESLRRICSRMMSKSPGSRYQSAGDVASILRDCLVSDWKPNSENVHDDGPHSCSGDDTVVNLGVTSIDGSLLELVPLPEEEGGRSSPSRPDEQYADIAQPIGPQAANVNAEPDRYPLSDLLKEILETGSSDLPIDALRICCPNGHEFASFDDLVGRAVLCPHCAVRFHLRRKDSLEYRQRWQASEARRARLWLGAAIVASVIVGIGILILIILS